MSERLFQPPSRFRGLPADGFDVFAIPDREARRRAIIDTFHPHLEILAGDLLEALGPKAAEPLHSHLPRLDWPRGYQPFCTWLALSRETQGYQKGPQLNIGVHADHVAIRLGWDTQAANFGRFEFLCRHGGIGVELVELASAHDLQFAVFAAAPWPRGSTRVFESASDWPGAFAEVARRGVWFEIGTHRDLPEAAEWVSSPELGTEALRVFEALLPVYERVAGSSGDAD
jgi:hypothetical protein